MPPRQQEQSDLHHHHHDDHHDHIAAVMQDLTNVEADAFGVVGTDSGRRSARIGGGGRNQDRGSGRSGTTSHPHHHHRHRLQQQDHEINMSRAAVVGAAATYGGSNNNISSGQSSRPQQPQPQPQQKQREKMSSQLPPRPSPATVPSTRGAGADGAVGNLYNNKSYNSSTRSTRSISSSSNYNNSSSYSNHNSSIRSSNTSSSSRYSYSHHNINTASSTSSNSNTPLDYQQQRWSPLLSVTNTSCGATTGAAEVVRHTALTAVAPPPPPPTTRRSPPPEDDEKKPISSVYMPVRLLSTSSSSRSAYSASRYDSGSSNFNFNSVGGCIGGGPSPSIMSSASSVALSRDMSDISGLSGGTFSCSRGNGGGGGGGGSGHGGHGHGHGGGGGGCGSMGVGTIPGHILDPQSFQRPWKQAYVLSVTPPEQHILHNNNDNNDNNNSYDHSSNNRRTNNEGAATSSSASAAAASSTSASGSGPSIWVPRNDVVEVFDNLQSTVGLDLDLQMTGHNRIPVLILLMNPPQNTYELLQIWVDRANDSVRDLVHVLQNNIPNSRDSNASASASAPAPYDGSSVWNQAYDGIFQVRGTHFTQLINIIRLGKYEVQPHEILIAKPCAMTAKMTIGYAKSAIRHLTNIGMINTNDDDGSQSGKRVVRSNVEDSPLLLGKTAKDRSYFPEGIFNHHHAIQYMTFSPPFESITPEMSNNQSERRGSGLNEDTLLLRGSNDHDGDHPESPQSPTSVVSPPNYTESSRVDDSVKHSEIEGNAAPSTPRAQSTNNQQQEYTAKSCMKSRKTRGILSRLNCYRSTEEGRQNVGQYGLDDNPNDTTAIASLSDEEEQPWLPYNLRPIAEEQSVAGGQSIVSASAPLLNQPYPNPTSTSSQKTAQHAQQNHFASYQQQQQRAHVGSGSGYKSLPDTAVEF